MMKKSKPEKKAIVFVASTIYGIEELLDRIYDSLIELGFVVWMSYKGTVPVSPGKTNPELCLEAVEKADCFVGILTGRAGSGKEKGELSIFHNEIKKAIELDKPRWFVVDHDVQVARETLGPMLRKGIEFVPSKIIQDSEVLEIFNLIHKPRKGFYQDPDRWVQEYRRFSDAEGYIQRQLGSYLDLLKLIENMVSEGPSDSAELLSDEIDGDSAAKIACSFLNGKGGRILFGVDADGSIGGVKDDATVVRTALESLKQKINPPPLLQSNYVLIDAKRVLLIDIPEGSEKPYKALGRCFVRVGRSIEETKPLEAKDKFVPISTAETRLWGSELQPGVSFRVLDEKSILHAADLTRTSKMEANLSALSPSEFLKALNLLRGNKITRAAIVLFGKNPHHFFPQVNVRCTRFSGNTREKMEELPPPLEGNLFFLLDGIRAFLDDELPQKIGTRTTRIVREASTVIPLAAWSEAIINALCHRDYLDPSSHIDISVFEDRLEIWNPGQLPTGLTLESLKGDHTSRPPNPLIAKAFLYTGLIEGVGRGTNRIVNTCVESGLPEPEFRLHSGGFEVRFYFSKPFAPNVRQSALLSRMAIGDSVTLAQYRKKEGRNVQERQAREDLRLLTKNGFVRREGKGRGTRYVRIK